MCLNYLTLVFVFFLVQVVEDWKVIAQVLDRMFLWTFLLVSVVGSLGLFVPVIYKWANIIVPIHIGNENKWHFPRGCSRNLVKRHIFLMAPMNYKNVNCVSNLMQPASVYLNRLPIKIFSCMTEVVTEWIIFDLLKIIAQNII